MRFYLHGDQHEERPQEYFCRACDLFVSADHFDSDEHKDHGRRYFDAVKTWDRGVARWKLPLRRAIDSLNILAIRANEGRLAAEAARSDFHRWIETQIGREDPVGELARDIMRDERFPKHAQTRAEVIGHIENVATWDRPIVAANEAWREFSAGRSETDSSTGPDETRMSSAEYSAAKDRSRIRIADIWHAATGVTTDQEWAWSSGRTPIPGSTANKITALLSRIEAGAEELRESLQPVLPTGCSIEFDEAGIDLVIQLPTLEQQVKVERKGVDRVSLAEVYEIAGAAVFLRVRPGVRTMPSIKQPTWVLWRGNFAEGAIARGPLQNYPNLPSEALLRQVLQRWI